MASWKAFSLSTEQLISRVESEAGDLDGAAAAAAAAAVLSVASCSVPPIENEAFFVQCGQDKEKKKTAPQAPESARGD